MILYPYKYLIKENTILLKCVRLPMCRLKINLSHFIFEIIYHKHVLPYFTLVTKELNTKSTKSIRSEFIKIRHTFTIIVAIMSNVKLEHGIC